MTQNRFEDDITFGGAVEFARRFVDQTTEHVTDEKVGPWANISASKVQPTHRPWSVFQRQRTSTPGSVETINHVCKRAGSLVNFQALLNTTGSSSNMDFDLMVNGSSVLSAAVNITNADSDQTPKVGTISSPTLAAGDVISFKLTVTTSTGATGPFAWCELSETSEGA